MSNHETRFHEDGVPSVDEKRNIPVRPPRKVAVVAAGYTYRSFGTSAWFHEDGTPVPPSLHIEIDRHMDALLREAMKEIEQ